MPLLVLLALPLGLLFGSSFSAHAQGVATRGGSWVWQNPLPQGGHLSNIWGTTADNVWAVGADGVTLKWDGNTWAGQQSATTKWLKGIWGSDANHVWSVGENGTIVQWDGNVWRAQDSGTTVMLSDVWGSNAANVWIAGEIGTILKWNGAIWSAQSSGTTKQLRSLWGSDANNVWAVGDNGTILRWNGAVWNLQNSGTTAELLSLWGSDANNVWAIGERVMLHWNGSSWSTQNLTVPINASITEIWSQTATDVWAIGNIAGGGVPLKLIGTTWQAQSAQTWEGLSGMWGIANESLWAVGDFGLILKWDGFSWSEERQGPISSLLDVWGIGKENIWTVGDGGEILNWNGQTWVAKPSDTRQLLRGIWGSSASQIWAVGNQGTILRWNGNAWKNQNTVATANLNSVWGSDFNNVWAAGDDGAILKWNGSSWNAQASGTANSINAVWGSDANNVWAVGENGTILYWNGSTWNSQNSGVTAWLHNVWGSDANNVWAVGDNGTVLKFNESAWHIESSVTTDSLVDIWGSDASNIWAVGFEGAVLKWDGSLWRVQTATIASYTFLRGVWSADANTVWIVGDVGLILRSVTHPMSTFYSGNGAGTVTTAPYGVACGANCQEYLHNTTITLTATAGTGSDFIGWSGACSGIGPCAVTMEAAKQVTATFVLTGSTDAHEVDDDCTSARPIEVDGIGQHHTLYRVGDEDWIRFAASTGVIYQIDAMPLSDSPADLVLELYDECDSLPETSQGYAFSPGARMQYAPTASGILYLRIFNHDSAVAGTHVAYQISVRTPYQDASPGALILVAGRKSEGDPVQPNISHVAHQVYTLFRDQHYDDDLILYLSADDNRPGVDEKPTASALRGAITDWARDKVDAQRPLTIFLVDHGDRDLLYLDEKAGQRVTPADLDAWLKELEAEIPGIKINIFIEACKSGSFIVSPDTVSGPGRVVVTSTSNNALAYTSILGAAFSDYLLAELGRNSSVADSFAIARQAAKSAYPDQNAWLDGDGDGVPNQPGDEAAAAQRGFAIAGTLGDAWPPYIAVVTPPAQVTGGRGVLRATVLDDTRVRRVWAVIYPPDYTPPDAGDELVQEILPTIVLLPSSGDVYAAEYIGFDQLGAYRVVFFAEDEDGLQGQPVPTTVNAGSRIMLPLVTR